MSDFIIMCIAVVIIYIFGFLGSAFAALHSERYYQEQWCNSHGGVTEYVFDDKSRVDCLTETHAIEVEFAPKWKEAIGQALYYSIKTNRKPGIVIVRENPENDAKYIKRLRIVSEEYGIELFEVFP